METFKPGIVSVSKLASSSLAIETQRDLQIRQVVEDLRARLETQLVPKTCWTAQGYQLTKHLSNTLAYLS